MGMKNFLKDLEGSFFYVTSGISAAVTLMVSVELSWPTWASWTSGALALLLFVVDACYAIPRARREGTAERSEVPAAEDYQVEW